MEPVLLAVAQEKHLAEVEASSIAVQAQERSSHSRKMKKRSFFTPGNILGITGAAIIGLIITRWITGFTPSWLEWLFDPEKAKLRKELESETERRREYWKAYIDTRNLGRDRIAALMSALDPYVPDPYFNYPFIDLSFAQLEPFAAQPFPGLPSPAEWQEILNEKLREAIKQQALEQGQEWQNWQSWGVAPELEL